MSYTIDLFATDAGGPNSGAGALQPADRAGRMTRIVEGADGVAGIESVWRQVASAARDQSVFSGFGFALSAARYHEQRGEKVITAIAEWNGRPACILPIAVRSRGGVAVAVALGDPVSQYSDALMVAGAPDRLMELALRGLVARVPLDVFEFRRVREDSALAPALASFARQIGAATEAPYADLAFETGAEPFLLKVAGHKQKRERARSRRRLAERGEVAFEALRGPAAIACLRHAFEMKRIRLARQGDASPVIDDPRALAVLERFAADPHDGEGLVVGRLTVAGVPAAYEVGLVRGRRFHAYLGAVADSFAGSSPGKVAMEEMLGWCLRQGLDFYDLLAPADDYKRRWSNGATVVRSYVAPMTLAGRLYGDLWLSEVRPRLRSTLDAMPAGLRRRIGAAALRAGAA